MLLQEGGTDPTKRLLDRFLHMHVLSYYIMYKHTGGSLLRMIALISACGVKDYVSMNMRRQGQGSDWRV